MFPVLVAGVLASAPAPAARLSVSPAAAPTPALKYQLLPEVRELSPGNPVQWYMRCFAEQRFFFFSKNAHDERARYLAMPLAELPADKLRGYGGSAISQADWGARLDTPDWQMTERVQAAGVELSQPEFGPLKTLGQSMRVRFRGEIADKRYDAAVRTAKTMLAFARHLGEHPTTEASRLGLVVAELALDTLDEMVQQPGAPNFYWALTDLPAPLVSLRKGAQGDRARVATELKPLREDAAMTDDELDEFVAPLSGRMTLVRAQLGHSPRGLRNELSARLKDADGVKVARGRLVAAGLAPNLVESFPPAQAVLLDAKRDLEVRLDDEAKLLGLAPWQVVEPAGGGDGLFADLIPQLREAHRAQARVEQRIGILRHVEALRLYAAAHGGKLPETLDEVGVPLPADPFTGKAFEYARDGATAKVTGKGIARYEVTVRK